MILPSKNFLRIEEVAARWRHTSGMPVRDIDIFDYIKQGVLPAYVLYKKEYYLVPGSELSAFDEYIGDVSTGHILFKDCSFVPPEKNLFDATVRAPDVRVDALDVYVKQKDLDETEKSASSNMPDATSNDENLNNCPEKPLGAVEREKLHLMIVALVELADLGNEKDNTVAKDIVCKVDVSQNTVVKHLRAARDTRQKKKETTLR